MFELRPDEVLLEFTNIEVQNEQNRPYDMNLIDELHADENAHSRILIKLLSYKTNDSFPIFEKFLKMLNEDKHLDKKYEIRDFKSPKFSYQYALIDAYISQRGKQSIIIENKIQWATDQDKQLERYIESSKADNIPVDQIYVVYLTDDGRKKVSDISLTKNAKEALGINDSTNGRYIELNYRYDILPFLQDILSYLDFSKEIYLKAALVQYIDYLKGRYGIREVEKEYYDSVNKDLKKVLSIQETEIISIANKKNVFSQILDFTEKLKETLNDVNNKESITFSEIVFYLNILKNEIYPEEIRPEIVAREVLYTFANKNKKILENYCNVIPFTEAEIIWRNPKMRNIVIFKIYGNPVLDISFTTTKIEFKIRTNVSKKEELEKLFENNNIFKNKETFVFEFAYEDHYKTIKEELKKIFKEMNELSIFTGK